MFGMMKSLGKAAVGLVVETPIAVVADVVTMGGVLTDKDEPYTKTALGKIVDNVERATAPNND
jgi:hypothetical protein